MDLTFSLTVTRLEAITRATHSDSQYLIGTKVHLSGNGGDEIIVHVNPTREPKIGERFLCTLTKVDMEKAL